jgi:hypothetical protein
MLVNRGQCVVQELWLFLNESSPVPGSRAVAVC